MAPDSTFSPSEVVRIQLEALRHNDEQDRGIAVAFRFASPANRANTGPLARFIAMIKEGPYALMLEFRDAAYGPVETISGQARQRVTLTGTRESVTYWFYLSRQSEAPYVDCWMTDSVLIEPDRGRVAQAPVPEAASGRAGIRYGDVIPSQRQPLPVPRATPA